MTAAQPWMAAVPWEFDPANGSSERQRERARQAKQEQDREQRMDGLKQQAALRRHMQLIERAALLDMGRDPATLPPVLSMDDIMNERPEALGIPLDQLADAVFREQDAEDGAKRRREQDDRRPFAPVSSAPPSPEAVEAKRADRAIAEARHATERASLVSKLKHWRKARGLA